MSAATSLYSCLAVSGSGHGGLGIIPTLAFEFDFTSAILGGAVALIVGVLAGFAFAKAVTGQSLSRAKSEAAEITRRAQDDAKSAVQRAELDAERRAGRSTV